ncbi:MAG: protein kinase [Polyangia bacterium]
MAEGQEAPVVSGGALATSAGSVMGTPAYMAPEQVKNSSAVDKRADIYAIGIMLYEVLTGRRPFEAESSAELMGAHMYMQAEPPSKVVAKNNVADRALNWQKLDPVVMRALAKKPEERYQDCSALQTDLEAAWGLIETFSARGATLQAPAVSAPAVQSAPRRKRRAASWWPRWDWRRF